MTMSRAALLLLLSVLLAQSHGFIQQPTQFRVEKQSQVLKARNALSNRQRRLLPGYDRTSSPRTHSVACNGFNLPPGKNDNGIQEILVGALSIAGLFAFFASPLGGLFFAAVNSVLALAFLTPLLLIFAFNVWQFFNTIEGSCPSCGAPIRLLKDGSPSICLNCGSVLQAGSDGSIDFAPGGSSGGFEQDDSLFGGFMGNQRPPKDVRGEYRRERTVIDVDVEDVDKK